MVDVLSIALVVAAVVWGYRQGLSPGAFALAGFAVGAILGSRVAPLLLDGGHQDPFAPAISLPAALLFGAILAALLERFGFQLRVRIRRRSVPDVASGVVLAACVGVVAVWVLGAAAAQLDGLKDPVRESSIIEELNAALPPPGPLLNPEKPPTDPLPVLAGPEPNLGPADPSIRYDRQVRSAARSVVKIFVSRCGGMGAGSGWVARDGIVVTNAHIVRASESGGVQVKVRGSGPSHDAETIYYDRLNDVAVLRVTGISGVPALPIVDLPRPKAGSYVAALGFPRAGPFRITPGRLGPTTRIVEQDQTVTVFRAAGTAPGSSGSPVVDRRGRVVTTLFAGRTGPAGRFRYGVPIRVTRRALRRAGPPADTGNCAEQ
ncbi:MAG: CvpA family protein [Actinomycetota bacterium]|nr:CvpA family protein [Actinomycetota bacterium]